MRPIYLVPLLAATLLPPVAAHAAGRLPIAIGVEAGIFLPSEAQTRDHFGGNWASFALSIGKRKESRAGFTLDGSVDVFWKSSGDDHAFIAPIGIEARNTFRRSGIWQPYAGVVLGPTINDVRCDATGAHSGLRGGAMAGLFGGVRIGPQAWLEARYYAMTPVEGFGFSGLNLTAGVRF